MTESTVQPQAPPAGAAPAPTPRRPLSAVLTVEG